MTLVIHWLGGVRFEYTSDFKKAFDSINRKVMFAVLRHYGIPEAVVNAISLLYKNSKSAVKLDGNLPDPSDVTTGVL